MTSATSVAPGAAAPAAPDGDGLTIGRRVALEVAAANRVEALGDRVGGLARASTTVLGELGLDVKVIRSRPGLLVVRSLAAPGIDAVWGCDVVRGWLDALPALGTVSPGSTTEPSCTLRGAPSCTHVLVWEETAAHVGGTGLAVSSVPAPSPVPAEEVDVARLSTPGDAIAVPSDPVPTPDGYAVDAASGAPTALPSDDRRRSWWARWPWARRRAWLLLVGLVAGACGGAFAASHGQTSYSATAVLEVAGPGSTTALSNAQGAAQLAVTYAALIPSDEALLGLVASELHTNPSVLARSLDVQAESGTALVEVRVTSTSPRRATAGANDVVRALSSGTVPGQAIAPGSMTVVTAARSAGVSGTLHKYGIPLGLLLGLLVGLGAVVVAERTDRRIDDVDSLAEAAGCGATRLPGGIPVAELARVLARSGGVDVSILPMRLHDRVCAAELARSLAAQRDAADAPVLARVDAGAPLAGASSVGADAEHPPVLVVTSGERASMVEDAASRLRRIGRDPVAAVLVCPPRACSWRKVGEVEPAAR